MKITDCSIDGLFIIEPIVFEDERGYFFEAYSERKYRDKGVSSHFVQDNESQSQKGVLRGLHYQTGRYAQSKLVRVIKGAVWDVAVDIREGSPTFGNWHGELLTQENKKQFFIPKGFAHGFLVLQDNTVFSYKCDEFYNKDSEAGISYNDPSLNIEWPELDHPLVISEKDLQNPALQHHRKSGIPYVK